MSERNSALAARDQDKVWDFYQKQTKGASIFDYAVPRLSYLFDQAERFAAGRKIATLNIGTGNGWLEERCHEAGWESWSLDPNPAAIETLHTQGINGVCAGIEAMPLDGGKFDVVFCSEVFEHLLDNLLTAGIGEINRVLKPGGILLGSVPYQEPLEMRTVVCPECLHVHHAYGHHQSFSRERLEALFGAAGFSPLYFRTRAFPGFKRRDTVGKLKSAIWVVFGRFGSYAADAKIVFAARKTATPKPAKPEPNRSRFLS